MSTTHFGLKNDYTEGAPVSAADLNNRANLIDGQTSGLLRAGGAGVLPDPDGTSFAVTAAPALAVNIAPGAGLARQVSPAYGAVYLRRETTYNLAALADNSTLYVFATIEVSGSNDSRYSQLPLFVAQAGSTRDGAILLAKVTTAGGTVTAVVDLRRIVAPLINRGAWVSTSFYKINDLVKDGGSWWIALLDNNNVTPAEGVYWTAIGGGSAGHVIKDEGTALTARSGLNFIGNSVVATDNAGANESDVTINHKDDAVHSVPQPVADASTTVKGGVTLSTAPASAAAPIAAGDNDPRLTDTRTPATHASTHLTGGTDPIQAATDAVPGLLSAADHTAYSGHVAAAAPHSGHLKADGTVASTATQGMGGFKITNLGTPVAATDATTKAYADALASGLSVKASVKVATTGNITLSGLQTIDSVSVLAGDRVLVKNQTTGSENGLYNPAAGAWTRTTDADTSAEMPAGTATFVEYGTTHQKQRWIMITPGITLGTTAQQWTQDSASGGEISTASNTGTGAGLIFKIKSGVDLVFKSLRAGSSKISVVNNTDDVTVDVVEANLTLNNIGGTLGPTKGGTGLTAATLGELLYASAANVWARLTGNTTTTRKFLRQTGNGTVSAAPVWDTMQANDYPVMIGSGATNARGAVPAPGTTAGTLRSLHEDGVWRIAPGGGYRGTSTSTVAIGTGSKVFVTQTNLAYTVGTRVRLTYQTDTTQWMEGVVTAYNITTGSTAMTVGAGEFNGSGTYALWYLNVAGEKGAAGTIGTVWRDGAGAPANSLGANGDYYLNDTTGDVYLKTAGAYAIVANIKGTTGASGAAGATGAAGTVWRDGAGAPSNALGVNGDYYLNDTNGDVYLKTAGTYAVVANIRGATGATGPTGATGATGPTGATGATGPAGTVPSNAMEARYANTTNPAGDIISNTTTETNFASKYTVPANSLKVGDVVRYSVKGYYTTDAALNGTLTFKLKLGATTLRATAALNTAAAISSAAPKRWELDLLITVKTIGSTGTCIGQGNVKIAVGTVNDNFTTSAYTGSGDITIDTTVANDALASVQWGTANANNVATLRSLLLEVGSTSGGSVALPADPSQAANLVKAGPVSGAAATPTYRALVAADVPALPESQITNLVTDLAAKAPLASPALTGTPTAPTAAAATNTTQVATTAFVAAHINLSTGVHGVNDFVVGTTDTQTLSSKRITPRAPAVTQSATPTINTNVTDVVHITGLAQAITSMTTNLSGTPVEGDLLWMDITDNGTAWAITWGASFAGMLPTSTVANQRIDLLFRWNTVTSKWRQVLKLRYARVYSTTSTATLTPEVDTYDLFTLTAQAAALTIANHSTSTPGDGEQIKIRILDNGTARVISHGTSFVAKGGIALPTTTTISKNMELLFEWNANLAKFVLLALAQES